MELFDALVLIMVSSGLLVFRFLTVTTIPSPRPLVLRWCGVVLVVLAGVLLVVTHAVQYSTQSMAVYGPSHCSDPLSLTVSFLSTAFSVSAIPLLLLHLVCGSAYSTWVRRGHRLSLSSPSRSLCKLDHSATSGTQCMANPSSLTH